MGIDDKVGSLKAGKRADLIMVSTRAANLGVFGDPAVMLVTAAQPANVDTVMVDGRILKRNGKLTHLNVDRIAKEAGDANAALRKRAQLVVTAVRPVWPGRRTQRSPLTSFDHLIGLRSPASGHAGMRSGIVFGTFNCSSNSEHPATPAPLHWTTA